MQLFNKIWSLNGRWRLGTAATCYVGLLYGLNGWAIATGVCGGVRTLTTSFPLVRTQPNVDRNVARGSSLAAVLVMAAQELGRHSLGMQEALLPQTTDYLSGVSTDGATRELNAKAFDSGRTGVKDKLREYGITIFYSTRFSLSDLIHESDTHSGKRQLVLILTPGKVKASEWYSGEKTDEELGESYLINEVQWDGSSEAVTHLQLEDSDGNIHTVDSNLVRKRLQKILFMRRKN